MNLTELKHLISNGESEKIEFKKTTAQQRQGTKTICGMLNHLGGLVIYGIDNNRVIKGQEVTTKTLEKLITEHRLISPMPHLEIETVSVSKKLKVIVVKAPGNKGLFHYENRAYLRNGPTTSIMPLEEYMERLIEKRHSYQRWENEYAPSEFTIKDLDEEEIQATLYNGLKLGRIKSKKYTDTESILRGLKLIKNGKLLNAAIALYGKSNNFYPTFSQFSIKLARFRGNNRLAEFTDNRQYQDHAFGMLRRAENFLLDHMPIASKIVYGKIKREDYPLYPPPAFREAVANAICHRDYTFAGGSVAIAIYNNYLEIINPGKFHFDITPEKLKLPHDSKPWNPLIANAFYCAGIIEAWGSGTLNIIDKCKENKNLPPKWEERTGCIVVTFFPRTFQKISNLRPESRPELRPESRPELNKKTLEETILFFLTSGPLSTSEIANALGHKSISGGLKKALRKLLNSKKITFTIPDKKESRLQKYQLKK